MEIRNHCLNGTDRKNFVTDLIPHFSVFFEFRTQSLASEWSTTDEAEFEQELIDLEYTISHLVSLYKNLRFFISEIRFL
jgi:hypothetical protein